MNFKRKKLIMFLMFICVLTNFSHVSFTAVLQDVPGQIHSDQMKCPMVVEFYRPSCPHCRKMAPIYEKVVAKCKNDTRFYKVNADNIGGANKIIQTITHNKVSGLSGVPTFVFVKDSTNFDIEKGIEKGELSEKQLSEKVSQLQ